MILDIRGYDRNIRGNDIKELYSRINISKFPKVETKNLWNKRKMFGLPS